MFSEMYVTVAAVGVLHAIRLNCRFLCLTHSVLFVFSMHETAYQFLFFESKLYQCTLLCDTNGNLDGFDLTIRIKVQTRLHSCCSNLHKAKRFLPIFVLKTFPKQVGRQVILTIILYADLPDHV